MNPFMTWSTWRWFGVIAFPWGYFCGWLWLDAPFSPYMNGVYDGQTLLLVGVSVIGGGYLIARLLSTPRRRAQRILEEQELERQALLEEQSMAIMEAQHEALTRK